MARVLVIGGGGREHALAWGLARSPDVDELVLRARQPRHGRARRVSSRSTPNDPAAVVALADELRPDLVVVGPEDPLVAGVVDALDAAGHLAFGSPPRPRTLEGSKAWMKDVLASGGGARPPATAPSRAGQEDAAFAFLETLPGLYVVKTDGLAAGKGVIVTESIADAREAVRAYLSGAAFGDAGRTCVIEEGMTGPELSVFVLCDGRDAQPFATAQDHKRAFDDDQGPNTGGMGAYSPVPFVPKETVDEVMERAIWPTLAELRARGAEYRGVLYCGLMLTPAGPKVIEYNIRFGDPECQVLVPRLRVRPLRALLRVRGRHARDAGRDARRRVRRRVARDRGLSDRARGRATSSTASTPRPRSPTSLLFHAGTRADGDAIVTNGGRV